MKALEILENLKEHIETESRVGDLDYSHYSVIIDYVDESIEELEQLDNDLKDLFSCIELTEDESYEKRFTSIETYLIRLSKFIK